MVTEISPEKVRENVDEGAEEKQHPTIQVEKLHSELAQLNALGSTVELACDMKDTEVSIDNDEIQVKL